MDVISRTCFFSFAIFTASYISSFTIRQLAQHQSLTAFLTAKGEVRSAAAESTSPYLFLPLPAIGWTGTKIHSAVPPYLKSSISSYLSRFHENFRSIVHNAGRALYFHTELQGRFTCTYGDISHHWYLLWAIDTDYWSSSSSFMLFKYVRNLKRLWTVTFYDSRFFLSR